MQHERDGGRIMQRRSVVRKKKVIKGRRIKMREKKKRMPTAYIIKAAEAPG